MDDDPKYCKTSSKLEMYCETPKAFHPAPSSTSHSRRHIWFCGALVIFVMNIMLMYLVHFTHNHDAMYAQRTLMLDLTLPESAAPGQLVSYTDDRVDTRLQSGAGTSVYLDISQHEPVMTNLILSTELMAYRVSKSQSCVISTFSMKHSSDLEIQPPDALNILEDCQPQDLVSLSPRLSMVLTWSPNRGTEVVPITIIQKKKDMNPEPKIKVLTHARAKVADRSVATRMGKLSSKSVVTAFYAYTRPESENDFDWTQDRVQQVSVQTFVNSSSNHGKPYIRTSAPLAFGPVTNETYQTHFSQPTAISGRPNTFAVVWYQVRNPYSDTNVPNHDSEVAIVSGLCLDVFSFDGQVLVKLKSACDRQRQPYYHMDVQALESSPGRFVVAYYDAANNYAMTLSSVELGSSNELYFRTHAVVSPRASGRFDFGNGPGFYPAPKLVLTRPSQDLALAYLPASGGRPILRVFDAQLREKHDSPLEIPLSHNAFEFQASGGSSETLVPVLELTLVALAEDNQVLSGVTGQVRFEPANEFALVQIMSAPVGVVTRTSQVAIAGVVDMTYWTKLTPGYVYYCTTEGQVVKGPLYRGQGQYHRGQNMVALEDNLYVSPESEIGLAISDHELVLTPN